jgi:hypothetical protein
MSLKVIIKIKTLEICRVQRRASVNTVMNLQVSLRKQDIF